MLTDERLRALWIATRKYHAGFPPASDEERLTHFARAVEREATAELRKSNQRLREGLKDIERAADDFEDGWVFKSMVQEVLNKESKL